jgi:UDP-N-acetylmuramate--alanine ligase
LKRLGIACAEGFNAGHVNGQVAAVIYSTAYGDDNVERRAARERGIPEWSYPEAVGLLFEVYPQSIAVAGSHGKTTTTAMLARILEEGGLDPTAIVGSTVSDWGRNARLGSSPWFVLEADEYQNKFQYYAPRYLLITNIDYDHPDYFPNVESYQKVFIDFTEKLPADGTLVLWGDEPLRSQLRASCPAKFITYGEGENNDWRLIDVVIADVTNFKVFKNVNFYGEFTVPAAGFHYALNAVGAIATADTVGVNSKDIARALKNFRGTARRLEYRGEFNKAIIIDDYAHHPTEISATIAALRARYPGHRLWCVFQAHTFSRTSAFMPEFVKALDGADQVILPPIYASAREQAGAVTSDDLARLINERFPGKAKAVASHEAAVEQLRTSIVPGDVVVTMGAGDVWQVAEALVQSL